MQFSELKLITPLLRAIEAEGYTTPSPIQQQSIPSVLEGRDVLGIAQTGTGKTAAFALPILQRLSEGPAIERPAVVENPRAQRGGRHPHRKGVAASQRAIRALILAPTRELATQITESFRVYGRQTGLRSAVVFGGVGAGAQISNLRAGVDILVACPGRLLDLINQGHVYLGGLQTFVLDEADRMLDMGFAPDIRRLLTHIPTKRQTLLFSATMPPEIQRLANDLLHDPVRVEVAPVSTPAERVEHTAFFVKKANKIALLQHLLASRGKMLPGERHERVLVFARTKRGADRVAEKLTRAGITANAIHGDKSQGQRERALDSFRRGNSLVMVATDLAARGLDVDGISHVINYDLPNEPETFVHRIGRTARAGASGHAISFCDAEEAEYLVDIEKLIQQPLPKRSDHPHHCDDAHGSHQAQQSRSANKKLINSVLRAQPHQQQQAPKQGSGKGGQQRRGGGGAQAPGRSEQKAVREQRRANQSERSGGRRPARGNDQRQGHNGGRSGSGQNSSRGERPRFESARASDPQQRRFDQPSGGQRVIRSARWEDE